MREKGGSQRGLNGDSGAARHATPSYRYVVGSPGGAVWAQAGAPFRFDNTVNAGGVELEHKARATRGLEVGLKGDNFRVVHDSGRQDMSKINDAARRRQHQAPPPCGVSAIDPLFSHTQLCLAYIDIVKANKTFRPCRAVVFADVLVGNANVKCAEYGRVVACDNVSRATVRCLADVRVGEGAPQDAVAPRRHIDLDPARLLLFVGVRVPRPTLVAIRGSKGDLPLLKAEEHLLRGPLQVELVKRKQRGPDTEGSGVVRWGMRM